MVKALRFLLNIMVVWMLTGFWHGADWNFILWGGFFGVILLIEKFFVGKALEKAPKPLRHVYVMLIIFVSWAFFDSAGFGEAFAVIGRMFGIGADGVAGKEALYYLRSYAVPFIFGALGATPLIKNIAERLTGDERPPREQGSGVRGQESEDAPNVQVLLSRNRMKEVLLTVLEPLILLLILVAATAKMVDGSFNPFIYFRF